MASHHGCPSEIGPRGLWEEDVRRARSMQPAERLEQAIQLSDLARALMVAGIRAAHPGAGDDVVLARLRQRLAVVRRLEAKS